MLEFICTCIINTIHLRPIIWWNKNVTSGGKYAFNYVALIKDILTSVFSKQMFLNLCLVNLNVQKIGKVDYMWETGALLSTLQ